MAGGAVLARDLFPTLPPALPQPSTAPVDVALAPMSSPGLLAALLGSSGHMVLAHSEAEAVDRVADGRSAAAVVSVAALAAHPDVISKGLKAVWLFGYRPVNGAVGPTCDPGRLRSLKLGAVAGSLAHFRLMALLAGEPLPPIATYDSDQALDKAYADGTISGGELSETMRESGKVEDCGGLPESAYAFVVVTNPQKPISASDLAAIVALNRSPPTLEQVGGFFQKGVTGIGTFGGVFQAASGAWSQVKMIAAPAPEETAVDRMFLDRPAAGSIAATPAAAPLDGGSPAPSGSNPAPSGSTPAPQEQAKAAEAPVKPFGYPSWLDR
jgi:hypothetical protein